ncbi:MAG: hypothetical protein K9M07_02075 [Simkaniaceae bacterium]|nr:hypothetical protein [Simkaniaceae bacterium]MCF7852009.1 hypothetical protein [Simkaniaceae bacterium]
MSVSAVGVKAEDPGDETLGAEDLRISRKEKEGVSRLFEWALAGPAPMASEGALSFKPVLYVPIKDGPLLADLYKGGQRLPPETKTTPALVFPEWKELKACLDTELPKRSAENFRQSLSSEFADTAIPTGELRERVREMWPQRYTGYSSITGVAQQLKNCARETRLRDSAHTEEE